MVGKIKKRNIKIIIFIIIILAVLMFFNIRIKKIKIIGLNNLTEKAFKEALFESDKELNPGFLFFEKIFKDKKEIPFVEDYRIKFKSLTEIEITVYEKSISGYVMYMNTCMFFDKDGIVVENSQKPLESVPKITGMEFENIVLHSKIPVKREEIFDIILNISQLLSKYKIKVNKINISNELEILLYINQFRVSLGTDKNISEKISALSDILPKMQDIPGELNMKEYNNLNTGYTFKKD